MTSATAILSSWAAARRTLHMSPERQSAHRGKLWRELQLHLSRTPAHAEWAGGPLESFPVRDVDAMRDDPTRWNSLGIDATHAMEAAMEAEHGGSGVVCGDVVAGLSTGTSGRRGLFLASARERAEYVGQSVASLLPWHAPLTGARIALVLRADSDLYRDVGRGRFSFLHLPLGMDPEDMMRRIRAFAPTELIAPPREMSALAALDDAVVPSLRRLLWGSEPMGILEREHVTARIGVRPDPIWQATEGFLGCACPHGTLHVNGGSIHIELEPVAGMDVLRPIVTDLRRTSQPIVRMRMDDLVRPSPTPCACGRGGMAVLPVEGRIQDVWRLPDKRIAPGDVDAAFERALGPEAQWSVEGSARDVTVRLDDARDADAAKAVVKSLHPEAHTDILPMPAINGPKRRRVTWSER